jgi:primosomal protein N' (replication factor Y)
MYVVDVIPLAFIPRRQAQILSYFYKEFLKIGAIVEFPLNRKAVRGVVISSVPLKIRKLDFKKGVDFELKNISKIVSYEPRVAGWQIKVASWLSDYYFSPLGVALQTVLPPFFGRKNYQFEILESESDILEHQTNENSKPKFIFSHPGSVTDKYYEAIKPIIASGKQVFLMVPNIFSADFFCRELSELNPILISSSVSMKKYFQIWQDISRGHVKLVIGTRTGLFLPFKNLGLVIVDDEANEFYKSEMTPRYQAVDVARRIALIRNAKIIFSAAIPRVKTYFEIFRENKFPFPTRQPFLSEIKLVNMISEIRAANFSIFSRDLQESLLENSSANQKTIIFVPRRGYANFIFCRHCGQSIKCPNCKVNLVFHQDNRPGLLCHHCRFSQDKPAACPNCGAFKLKPHGIGTQKVYEGLKKTFGYKLIKLPKILILDSDHTQNAEKEKSVLEEFKSAGETVILLATQMLFSHCYEIAKNLKIKPVIAIISADSLDNFPDYRTQENSLRQILTLSQIASRLIIQTHDPENMAIKTTRSEWLKDFFDSELASRKTFFYPPFADFIKLSCRHKNEIKASQEASNLSLWFKKVNAEQKLGVEIIGPYSPLISKERNFFVKSILLKIKCGSASVTMSEKIKKRNQLLRETPSGWVVDVDPTSAT